MKTKMTRPATRILAGFALLACVAPTAHADSRSHDGLRIMLTNDDGWNAPGITAVYDALVADGHEVTLVAPATNQSGGSARVTFGGALSVVQQQPGKYSVAGTPADSTEFGLSVVFADNPPDLVISGTNAGQNIAAATIHSGTVGAAVTALDDGVPAIAVSTELDFATGTGPYAETAAFVADLVEVLERRPHRDGLLPSNLGLNVNYPLVEGGGRPAGVALTQTGRGFLDVTYADVALPEVGQTASYGIQIDTSLTETVRRADSTALAQNKVAITPIEGDYDASPADAGQLRKLLRRLR